MIENFTLGADPEMFIVNKSNGKVISAIGLIPGTKAEPCPIKELGDGFAMQTDNILSEFNIPKCYGVSEFIDNIKIAKSYIQKYVKSINKDLDILCAASMDVDSDQLQHKQAKLFGCDPDYNAYTEERNPKPVDAAKHNLRSAGFHIHIGYENNNIDESLYLIKVLDTFLGLPSVIRDTDTRRRSLYGKAGSFRLKPFGLEYRVLSSKMLEDDNLIFVAKAIGNAINAYNCGKRLPKADYVRLAIDSSNVDLAKLICNDYCIKY